MSMYNCLYVSDLFVIDMNEVESVLIDAEEKLIKIPLFFGNSKYSTEKVGKINMKSGKTLSFVDISDYEKFREEWIVFKKGVA